MNYKRLPSYLKKGIIDTEKTKLVRHILKENCLNTVCDSARCPNKSECYAKNTATFLIMGNNCTRNCRFCNITCAMPEPLNPEEPQKIADAVKKLNLNYVVITSVTRDDLQDGGANHFAAVISAIKNIDKNIKTEVLTPDFKGRKESIDIVINAHPDVFNHNIETVPSLYSKARPQADYQRSLNFLKYIKDNSNIKTKTGLMVGLGETKAEIINVFKDLVNIKCDIVTIGQYIAPSKQHIPVEKYYEPSEYDELALIAKEIGIKHTSFSPLTRSSYKAFDIFCEI
ncbi:MAG: lipoyl synthase [Candidatus Gastranaerophilales bacterium]|nr:lipoyl synthase [Candidatus Gastranaerophilales bacterium]